MLKINNIFILLLLSCLFGCRTIPDGTPPKRTVDIIVSDGNKEKISVSEAINMVSTALAVEVFAKTKGSINILFKQNPAAEAVTRRVYQELKMFQPVRSVLNNENFVLESSIRRTTENNRVWQLNLKNRQNKTLWSETIFLKDGELK